MFPKGVEHGRNRKYQTWRKEGVSPLLRNQWFAICGITNCHKNGAVIKINYFPFCRVCEGRKLTPTAREMRKHPFHTILRMRFHNLSLPQMPFLPRPCSLLLRAVLSPSSSIKLSPVFLWSAVHSLSHHCTISRPTSGWNSTLRSCSAAHWCPSCMVQREHALFCQATLRSVRICVLKKLLNVVWLTYRSNSLCPRQSIRKNKKCASAHPVG